MPLIHKKQSEILKYTWGNFIIQNIPQIIIQSILLNKTKNIQRSKLYRVCLISLIFSSLNLCWSLCRLILFYYKYNCDITFVYKIKKVFNNEGKVDNEHDLCRIEYRIAGTLNNNINT
eukprot:UN05276